MPLLRLFLPVRKQFENVDWEGALSLVEVKADLRKNNRDSGVKCTPGINCSFLFLAAKILFQERVVSFSVLSRLGLAGLPLSSPVFLVLLGREVGPGHAPGAVSQP